MGVLGATRRIKINSAISISGRSQDPSWRVAVSVGTILSFSSDVFKKCTKIACFAPLRFKMLRRLVLKIALLSLLRSPSLRHCGLKCLIKLDRTLIKIKRNLIKNHLREVGSPPGRYFMRGVGGQIAGKVKGGGSGPWASWGRPEESRLIRQSRFLVAPKIPLGGSQ